MKTTLKGFNPPQHLEYISKCGMHLTKFPSLKKHLSVHILKLSDNPLSNFEGMIEMPVLENLHLQNTNI